MSEAIIYNNISFDKIFPQCRDDFNITISDSNNLKEMRSELFNLCNSFIENNACNKEINYANLLTICEGLVFYLYHIKNNSESNDNYKNLACKYFNYKLQDMLNKYECKSKDPQEGYSILKQYWSNHTTIENSFLNICDKEVTKFEDSTLKIFKYFDQLYYALTLLDKGRECTDSDKKFKNYVNELESYVSNNSSIATLLNNLITRYNKSIPKSKSCDKPISLTELPLIKVSETETSLTQKTQTDKFLNVVSENGKIRSEERAVHGVQIKHSNLSMGKWVGIVVSSSVLLIMSFFLYKYTRNASFIGRSVRKLRKLLNKKSENYNDVMGSSEETYKNRIHKHYKVAYV
ncbi:variable surface protein [Plasmodium gonderi]|uniref:Variable surface protein n=1 Tax=Plasmodium gonderi TaxID=77519 RepID=A0A1Y1JPW0_PLAGO|nr:variable surface protein [Plasmodium gonderi]GAW84489.1 variable surface protein [Plasmodium gonderi]